MTDLYDLLLAQKLSGGGGGGGGGAKNTQVTLAAGGTSNNSMTPLNGVTLTVAKSGTYTVSWFAARTNSSKGAATQLYINGRAYGEESNTYESSLWSVGKLVALNNVPLNDGDVLSVYGKSSAIGSYAALAGNLAIVEE